MRRRRPKILHLAVVVPLVVALAACGGQAATDTPEGVTQQAVERLGAGDLDGLRALACAGQEDVLRQELGAGLGVGSLLPGLDLTALAQAVQLDTSKLKVGTATVSGDTATVPVTGDIGVTLDAATVRPVLKQLLEAQGATVDDQMLDALLTSMEQFGQDVPIDQALTLTRESGAWKICQAAP